MLLSTFAFSTGTKLRRFGRNSTLQFRERPTQISDGSDQNFVAKNAGPSKRNFDWPDRNYAVTSQSVILSRHQPRRYRHAILQISKSNAG
jgi:hypothetical protein